MRLVTKREAKQPTKRGGIPEGFEPINANVYVHPKTGAIVITGDPISDDIGESSHNCDAAGCRWEHVMFYGIANGHYREALGSFMARRDR